MVSGLAAGPEEALADDEIIGVRDGRGLAAGRPDGSDLPFDGGRIGAAVCTVCPEDVRCRAPLPGGGEPARRRVQPCGEPEACLRDYAALRRDRTAGAEPDAGAASGGLPGGLPVCAGNDGLPGNRRAGRLRRAGGCEAPLYGGRRQAVSHGIVDGRRRCALAGIDAPGPVGSGGAGVRRCVSGNGGPGSQRAQSSGAFVSRRPGPGGARGVFAAVAPAPADTAEPGGVHRISRHTPQCLGPGIQRRQSVRLVRQIPTGLQSGPRTPGDARPGALRFRLLGAHRRAGSGRAGFGGCGAVRRRDSGADAGSGRVHVSGRDEDGEY